MRQILFSLVLIAAFAALGCQPPADHSHTHEPVDVVAEEAAIREINPSWLEMQRARDAAGIVALFAEDGMIVSSDGGVIAGKDALMADFESDFAEMPDGVFDWTTEMVSVDANGTMAWEQGSWTVDPDGEGEAASRSGHYVTVFKKVDGEWKIAIDIANRLTPAGDEEAASE